MSRDNTFDPYHVWLQIPKESRPPTLYQLLGVAPSEKNVEVIRQAKLMRASFLRNYQIGEHADDAARLLEELENAALVLGDAERRAAYDASLKPAEKPSPTVGTMPVRPVVAPPIRVQTPSEPVVKHRKKAGKTHARRQRARLRDWAYVVLGLAIVGGVGAVLARAMFAPNRAVAESKNDSVQPDEPLRDEPIPPKPKPDPADDEKPTPRQPPTTPADEIADALRIEIDVEPIGAELAVEPIWGGGKEGAHRLSGTGGKRTLEISKTSLPVVLTAKADGYFTEERVLGGSLLDVTIRLRPKDGHLPSSAPPTPRPNPDRRVSGPFRTGIPFGEKNEKANWRYTPNDPGFSWTFGDFNDSKWSEGVAPFGNRAKTGGKVFRAPGLHIQTTWTSTSIWLRRRLSLPKEIAQARIRWRHRHDHSLQVYVNGRLQFERRGWNWTPAEEVRDGGDFAEGENVVAVRCVNDGGPGFVEVGFDWAPTEAAR
jgi:hypothetical protein